MYLTLRCKGLVLFVFLLCVARCLAVVTREHGVIDVDASFSKEAPTFTEAAPIGTVHLVHAVTVSEDKFEHLTAARSQPLEARLHHSSSGDMYTAELVDNVNSVEDGSSTATLPHIYETTAKKCHGNCQSQDNLLAAEIVPSVSFLETSVTKEVDREVEENDEALDTLKAEETEEEESSSHKEEEADLILSHVKRVLGDDAMTEMTEEFRKEYETELFDEEQKLEARMHEEKALLDAANHARDTAELKLTADQGLLDIAHKAITEAKEIVSAKTSDKSVFQTIMERREAELASLRTRMGNEERGISELKAAAEEAANNYQAAVHKLEQKDKFSDDLEKEVIEQTISRVKAAIDRRNAFETQKLKFYEQLAEHQDMNDKLADGKLATINDEIATLSNDMFKDIAKTLQEQDEAIKPLFNSYKSAIDSIEKEYQKTADEINQERFRVIQQKRVDLQRPKLTIEKVDEIRIEANNRIETLRSQLKQNTDNVHVSKMAAFDTWLKRKNNVIEKYTKIIDSIKSEANDKMDLKIKDIAGIKLEAEAQNKALEKEFNDKIDEAEKRLGEDMERDQKSLTDVADRALLARQDAESELMEVDKVHKTWMEADRNYATAKLHGLAAFIAAKNSEVEMARVKFTDASQAEQAAILEVRHAQARVREIEDIIKRDEQLIKRYHKASKEHDEVIDKLQTIDLAPAVRKHVKKVIQARAEEAKKKAEEEAHQAALAKEIAEKEMKKLEAENGHVVDEKTAVGEVKLDLEAKPAPVVVEETAAGPVVVAATEQGHETLDQHPDGPVVTLSGPSGPVVVEETPTGPEVIAQPAHIPAAELASDVKEIQAIVPPPHNPLQAVEELSIEAHSHHGSTEVLAVEQVAEKVQGASAVAAEQGAHGVTVIHDVSGVPISAEVTPATENVVHEGSIVTKPRVKNGPEFFKPWH